MRRFVSHSLWGCCQFGDCSMKSLPFDISLSLGLLFTCHLLITSWSALQKLRQGCFDNHQINCWDTFCGDSWAIRSEAVVSLEIVQFPFFSRVVSQIFQSPHTCFNFSRHFSRHIWEFNEKKHPLHPLTHPSFRGVRGMPGPARIFQDFCA